MKAQLKYSFKKEKALFVRRYHLLGIVLAVFGFAIADPLICRAMDAMMKMANEMQLPTQTAQISAEPSDITGAAGLDGIMGMFQSAAFSFGYTLSQMRSYSLLIIMLVTRSAAGGEQRKRTMIVPMCGGLKYKNYLIPKFVIYPLSTLVLTFLGGMTAGGLCNALFTVDPIGVDIIAFSSLVAAVYCAFIITIYLALGLCTSRPGLMTGAVYLGQMILPSLLEGMGLTDYQPFMLVSAASSMVMMGKEYGLSDKLPSIFTAMGLCVVISVLMYFLAWGVLGAKKIDNTAEDKPAF